MTAPKHNPNRAPLPSERSTNSFWHKEPSKVLFGHRSTEELPANADVVIVGSGIAGAFAAWELLKGGDGNGNGIKSVVMLEAREACWGATGRVSLLFLICYLLVDFICIRSLLRLYYP